MVFRGRATPTSGYRRVSSDYLAIIVDSVPPPEVLAGARLRTAASTPAADRAENSSAEGLDTLS